MAKDSYPLPDLDSSRRIVSLPEYRRSYDKGLKAGIESERRRIFMRLRQWQHLKKSVLGEHSFYDETCDIFKDMPEDERMQIENGIVQAYL